MNNKGTSNMIDHKTMLYRRNRRYFRCSNGEPTNIKELLALLQSGKRLEVMDKRIDGKIVTRESLLAILFYEGHNLITQSELETILMRKPQADEPASEE